MTEDETDTESEKNGLQEYSCSSELISRIRFLFEHTCEMTEKLDDGINLIVGTQLLYHITLHIVQYIFR